MSGENGRRREVDGGVDEGSGTGLGIERSGNDGGLFAGIDQLRFHDRARRYAVDWQKEASAKTHQEIMLRIFEDHVDRLVF